MTKIKAICFAVILCGISVSRPHWGSCRAAEAISRLRVVATTTLIGSIISAIGEDTVEVVTLVPGAMCPGHFDIGPGTMKKIARADLCIRHAWEKWVQNIFNSVDNAGIRKAVMATEGNWMVPDVHMMAAKETARILYETDTKNKPLYERNLKHYLRSINAEAERIRRRYRRYAGTKIVCSEQQAQFLAWFGFSVIATYGRPEDFNIKGTAEVIAAGKRNKVRFVVDNLQSGPNAGVEIAKSIGAHHVVLTNFPEHDSYIEALRSNTVAIEQALP